MTGFWRDGAPPEAQGGDAPRPGFVIEAAATAATLVALADAWLHADRAEEGRALCRHLADALPDERLAAALREHAGAAAALISLTALALRLPGVAAAPAHLHEAYFLLGCALEESAPHRALRCHVTAMALQPDYAAAYDRCGGILRRQDRLAEAAARLGQALRLDPGLRDAAVSRAFLLARLGRLADAQATLAAVGGGHDDLVRLNEATLLVAQNRLHDALGMAAALLFRQPGLQPARALLEQLFDRLGMPEEAREVARPDLLALARTYFERGAHDAAGSLLRALHARTGAVPGTLLALAEWQLETALHHQVEPYLGAVEQAALTDVQRVLFVSLVARLRVRQKALDEAWRILRPYRGMAPQSWWILQPWLELCVAAGLPPDEADLAALDHWRSRLGHHAYAQFHAARLLFAFGRTGAAVDTLRALATRPRWSGAGGAPFATPRWFDAFQEAFAIAGAEEATGDATPRQREQLFRTLDQAFVEVHRLRRALCPDRPPPRRAAAGRPKEARIAMTSLGHHGRFGNQIFQYAFLKLYAQRHGVTAETPDWCGRYLFEADDPPAEADLPPFYDERLAFDALEGTAPPVLNGRDIDGFFMPHTSRYAGYRDAFCALFRPGPAVAARVAKAVARLKGDGGRTLIAVHVRRGDFGGDQFWLYPEHFYLAWLDRVWPSLRRPVLYVASDDPAVVGRFDRFAPVTLADVGADIEGAPYFMDHCVMQHADGVLISNSSYSFSACLLNEAGRLFLRPPAKDQPLVRFDPWNDRIIW